MGIEDQVKRDTREDDEDPNVGQAFDTLFDAVTLLGNKVGGQTGKKVQECVNKFSKNTLASLTQQDVDKSFQQEHDLPEALAPPTKFGDQQLQIDDLKQVKLQIQVKSKTDHRIEDIMKVFRQHQINKNYAFSQESILENIALFLNDEAENNLRRFRAANVPFSTIWIDLLREHRTKLSAFEAMQKIQTLERSLDNDCIETLKDIRRLSLLSTSDTDDVDKQSLLHAMMYLSNFLNDFNMTMLDNLIKTNAGNTWTTFLQACKGMASTLDVARMEALQAKRRKTHPTTSSTNEVKIAFKEALQEALGLQGVAQAIANHPTSPPGKQNAGYYVQPQPQNPWPQQQQLQQWPMQQPFQQQQPWQQQPFQQQQPWQQQPFQQQPWQPQEQFDPWQQWKQSPRHRYSPEVFETLRGKCHLCFSLDGHFWRDCPIYIDQTPTDNLCTRCNRGMHEFTECEAQLVLPAQTAPQPDTSTDTDKSQPDTSTETDK